MRRQFSLYLLLALFSAGVYLGFSALGGAAGFPLDDAWIHQVYARNLGTRGEFAFFAGQSSAGSTAPLWTMLLSLGYLLRIEFHAWAYLGGALLMGASALLVARLAEQILEGTRNTQFASHSTIEAARFTAYCSLFTVFEWHLAWSAVSGMEISLFVFLSLLLLERFYAGEQSWVIGVVGGLLTLTRPEGVALAGLVGLGTLFSPQRREERKENMIGDLRVLCVFAVQFGFGFALVLTPFLIFNLAVSGSVFPNTFFAKNAEYQELLAPTPFLARGLQLLFIPFVGAQLLLIPGVVYAIVTLARRKNVLGLIPFLWLLLLPALYALRLPVAYQHGRYEMPIIPFIVVYGIAGTAMLLRRVRNFVMRATWALSTAATLIAFWLIGGAQYATDVAIIDCEMVQTARWIAAHTPRDALVAAHDIGALGYYYDQPFIDLAGLVSPEVIPFIRDESRLREYLFLRNAQYAIFFPDWYPSLASDSRFTRVSQTDCTVTRREGGTNMAVYRILR